MARWVLRRRRSARHKRRVPVAVHHVGREGWLTIDSKWMSVIIGQSPWLASLESTGLAIVSV
jgi:hypothetical protein